MLLVQHLDQRGQGHGHGGGLDLDKEAAQEIGLCWRGQGQGAALGV